MNRADARDPVRVGTWSELPDREPTHARVEGVDLVVVRYDDAVSVLYGRCLHRGVLLGDGYVEGRDLVCGVHGWDYRVDTGISEYDNSEVLEKFSAWVDQDEDAVFVDAADVASWAEDNPQPYGEPDEADSATTPGFYGEPDPEKEPHTRYIQKLAREGPDGIGEHGRISAMGVPRTELPSWDHLQILTAQLARTPRSDDAPVDTELVIGPEAESPLRLDIPVFVSDMSFGALGEEGATIDYDAVPAVVFTSPEVASVGTTELEYMDAHGTCSCRTARMEDVPRAKAVEDTDGLVQVVKHHETDEIVGVHMVAPRAAGMIVGATLAVKFGLTVDDVIDTVHPFPTFSEAFKHACQAFRRDTSTMSCCVE